MRSANGPAASPRNSTFAAVKPFRIWLRSASDSVTVFSCVESSTNGSLEMTAADPVAPGLVLGVVVGPPPQALATRPSARANTTGTRRFRINDPPFGETPATICLSRRERLRSAAPIEWAQRGGKRMAKLSSAQLDAYRRDGYVLYHDQLFGSDEMERLTTIFEEQLAQKGEKLSD